MQQESYRDASDGSTGPSLERSRTAEAPPIYERSPGFFYIPPVTNMTLPDRSGISVSALKDLPPKPNIVNWAFRRTSSC